MSEQILVEKRNHVTIATLNRPHRHNAIDHALATALGAVTEAVSADPEQRVLIITGSGNQAFCSGADLKSMGENAGDPNAGRQAAMPIPGAPDIANIADCEKPVIGAINGLAVGGGLELALCCDIRIASENAWFALPEPTRGFIAGIAVSVLPRLMPIGAVMDMMLTGERLNAADACRLGLVQGVFRSEDLLDAAMRKAEKMAAMSQPALWGTKAAIRYWRDLMLHEQHRHYQAIVHRVLLSSDMAEGLAAFGEKREPRFGKGWPVP
jgi:enoyl-CoA hydratase/carnithine racemase